MNDSFKNAVRGLSRALNALRGQGHGSIGDPNHKPGCPLCSAAELIMQSFYYLTDSAPAQAREEAQCDECSRVRQELGAGCAMNCDDAQHAACANENQDSIPVIWQLDYSATLPDGQTLEGIESEGSWFLLDQQGTVWEYGPSKPPAPISKMYTRAIPRFKVGENKYMAMGAILAALRSCQSPQAEDAIETFQGYSWDDIKGKFDWLYEQINTPAEYEAINAIHRYVAELRKAIPAAAPQPSPQGEDALSSARIVAKEWINRSPGYVAAALDETIRAYDALRARLASAQSSAQGEEAAYNHAEVFHRRLVAAQEAIKDFPVVVTELVRGYGIDVNEKQIDTWLRDALNRKTEARAALERKEGE